MISSGSTRLCHGRNISRFSLSGVSTRSQLYWTKIPDVSRTKASQVILFIWPLTEKGKLCWLLLGNVLEIHFFHPTRAFVIFLQQMKYELRFQIYWTKIILSGFELNYKTNYKVIWFRFVFILLLLPIVTNKLFPRKLWKYVYPLVLM